MKPAAAKMRTAVLVSGSGTNLQAIIDGAEDESLPIELCAVLSDRESAFGLERARRAGVTGIAVRYKDFPRREAAEQELQRQLTALKPELVVLAGFMRVLPEDMVVSYRGRMLNVHPSLLPKYRGLNTFRRVLEAGDRWHGSTVHFVVPMLDAGPSIIQYRIRVRAGDTEDSLKTRVQAGEYMIYPRAIRWFANGQLKLKRTLAHLNGKPLRRPIRVTEEPGQ